MTTQTLDIKSITGHEFCWCEVATRDAQACAEFYGALLGWTTEDHSMEGHPYTYFQYGGQNVGGMMTMDENWPAEVPAHWLSYVFVKDIEALADRAVELGASLCVPVTEIPPGSFCVITDPQGAVFALFQGNDNTVPTGDKAFGWWELASTDVEGSIAFYTALLGWDVRLEEMFQEQKYWCCHSGETMVAAMHEVPEHWGEGHPSCWTPSGQCHDIDEVVAKVPGLGGNVYREPENVTPFVRYAAIQDPTGAVLTLYTYIGDPSACCGDGSCGD